MARLFYPNLMFEEQLTGQASTTIAARQLVADLAPVMAILSDSNDDAVLVESDSRPGDLPGMLRNAVYVTADEVLREPGRFDQMIPWGISQQARQLAQQFNLPLPAPPHSAVVRINSRRFLANFDRIAADDMTTDDQESSAPFASSASFSRLCHSLHDVSAWLEENIDAQDSWVAKAEFSQAARNRLLGQGRQIAVTGQRWLSKQFEAGHVVAIEPWVSRLAEFGLQLEVIPEKLDRFASPAFSIRFLGAPQMLTTQRGQYCGSLMRCSTLAEPVWLPARRQAMAIGRAAADVGYHGVLGIDCMWYAEPHQEARLRMAHDINGRYTMGRLALELAAGLPEDVCGAWLHLSTKALEVDVFPFAKSVPAAVRVHRTSPGKIGARCPRTTTWLLASDDQDALLAAVSQCTH